MEYNRKRIGDKMMEHLLRHKGLLYDILEAQIRTKRGRSKLDYCSQIESKMQDAFREMCRLTQDRKRWRYVFHQSSDFRLYDDDAYPLF